MKISLSLKTTSTKATNYQMILYHFTNYLRSHVKYGSPETAPDIDTVYDEWWKICQEYKVDPYEEDI